MKNITGNFFNREEKFLIVYLILMAAILIGVCFVMPARAEDTTVYMLVPAIQKDGGTQVAIADTYSQYAAKCVWLTGDTLSFCKITCPDTVADEFRSLGWDEFSGTEVRDRARSLRGLFGVDFVLGR